MRVAIFGTGNMAYIHAQSLARIDGVAVAGFVSHELPVAPRTAALAQALGAAIVPRPALLLERPEVEAVVVATPTDAHAELAIAAAQAGKHIICEKPLARNLEQAERMLQAVEQAGVKLAVGQVVRYFPEYAAVHELVLRGELGRPGVSRATRAGSFPRTPSNWYADFARSGGVVLDMMIHDLDWMRWTFGPVERLYARGLSFGERAGKDMAMVTLRFRSGALAYVEASWCEPAGFYTTLEVSGSGGLVHAANQESRPLAFRLAPAGDTAVGVEVPTGGLHEDPYLAELRDFVRWFKGGPAPRCSAEDGFEALRLSLAALESISSGQPVVFAADA